MYAAKDVAYRFVAFIGAGGRPDEREGLEIQDDVWIEIAPNQFFFSEKTRPPETVLCQSVCDSSHYKLYRHRREIPEEFREVGLDFAGSFSKESWSRFDHSLRKNFPIDSTESD